MEDNRKSSRSDCR